MAKMWAGCALGAWWSILRRGRFRVAPARLPEALFLTAVSLFNTAQGRRQARLHGNALERHRIPAAPVIIVGHWRSGTTHLHRLVNLDPQFVTPTFAQCLVPGWSLLIGPREHRHFEKLIPPDRVVDAVPTGPDTPQEDEFALCNLGLPSILNVLAFPNTVGLDENTLSLRTLPAAELDAWKQGLVGFLKAITLKDSRRLLVKSPMHTYRLPILLELFPDARFVHIVRSPYAVIPSTRKLWRTAISSQTLQRPDFSRLDEDVFALHARIFERVEEARPLMKAGQFQELRFEDLVADPLKELEKLYAGLALGDFAEVRPRIKAYLDSVADYKANPWKIPGEDRSVIAQRCGKVLERYAYPTA